VREAHTCTQSFPADSIMVNAMAHHELQPLPPSRTPNNGQAEEQDLEGRLLLEDPSGGSPDQHGRKVPENDYCNKPATEVTITTQELDPDTDKKAHRPSNASSISVQPGIYRRTPMVMIFGLLIGMTCFIGHNFWYRNLDGELVGSAHIQQQNLRVGTTLAVCAQVSLVFSIQRAFEQWLWRELKSHIVSFKGIDAACAATKDPSALVHKEVWRKAKRASTLALLTWLLPIATFISPATLNVHMMMMSTTHLMSVQTLNIAQASQYTRYTYAVAGVLPSIEKFLGARSIIERWAVASASTGQLPSLPQPATNATYNLTFYTPYVHCGSSTPEVIQQVNNIIDQATQAQDPSVELVSIDYFAIAGVVQGENLTNLADASPTSNQLWMYFTSYKASLNFTEPVEKHYLTCQLYNSSQTVRFSWENGVQDLNVLNRTLLHPVAYPVNGSTSPESEEAMSYSAVMWALSSQLTGSIAFYKDLNATGDVTQETYAGRVYSQITSNIGQSSLIGSSDFNSHFAENHLLGNGSGLYSDQRWQDMAYAGDRPLEVLIPELSSNITLSLFMDPLLA
jgi:hypothetical protein